MAQRNAFLAASLAAAAAAAVAVWLLWPATKEPASAAVPGLGPEASDRSADPATPTAEVDSAVESPAAPERQVAQATSAPGPAAIPVAEEEAGSGAKLVVHVTSEVSGAPLSGVRLWVFPKDPETGTGSKHVDGSKGSLESSPKTGDDGRGEFELPPATELQLSVDGEAVGAGSKHLDVPALKEGERREFAVQLPTGNDLRYFGQVLQREGRSPVPAARVRFAKRKSSLVTYSNGNSERRTEETVLSDTSTDSQGRFELWVASWSGAKLRIDAEGYGPLLSTLGRGHETPEKAREFLLSRSASLRARLADSAGVPLTEGSLKLWTEDYHLDATEPGSGWLGLGEVEWRASADPNGLCVLSDLPPDVPLHVQVVPKRGGKKKDFADLTLRPGEAREIEWKVGSGCRLHGSVVDSEGAPVAGCAVWRMRAEGDAPKYFQKYEVRTAEEVTDAEGRFSFADVDAGRWWVGPAAERDDDDPMDPQAIAPVAEVVEIVDGTPERELVLRVCRGIYIQGRVLSGFGDPAADCFVLGMRQTGGFTSTQSRDDGTFSLGPLCGGRFKLVAHGMEEADSDTVEADAGANDVVLRLNAGARLVGTVVDAASGTGCRASITCSDRERSDASFRMTGCQDDGAFTLRGLPPGTYAIVAQASGARVGILRDVVAEPNVEVRDLQVVLRPGATLRIRYAGAEGYLHCLVRADGAVVCFDGIAAQDDAEITVPAGHLVLDLTLPGTGEEQRELDIAVGEKKEVVIGAPK